MTDGSFDSPSPGEDTGGLAALERDYADLAESVRGIVDACVRTRVDPGELTDVAREVRGLTERLLTRAQEGPLGVETTSDGRLRDHGNPMAGMRNPVAPPLDVVPDGDGGTRTTFVLGAAYEGPPGCLHGGMIAAILDQVIGAVPARAGLPGLTAYLNTTYRRPTLLGVEHTAVAWLGRIDGWKVFAGGEIRDPGGRVTAEGEALFVVPKWAREHVGTATGDAGDFAPPTAGS